MSRIRPAFVNANNVGGVAPSISQNWIDGATFQSTLQARAMMLTNSSNFFMSCNNLRNTGSGLYFNGNCLNTVRQNTIRNHRFGLWLESATIGQQGSLGYPSENVWAGSWNYNANGTVPLSNGAVRYKTYVSGTSNATASALHVRNSLTHNPNLSGNASWARENFGSFAYNSASSIIPINNANPVNGCAYSGIITLEDSIDIMTNYDNFISSLALTTSELDSLALLEASARIKEMALYERLDLDSSLRDSSAVLYEFYDERTEENIGRLREMERHIGNREFEEAEDIRDQIIANNGLEVAHLTVLNLILKHEKDTFTLADSIELVYWATSCSFVYGKIPSLAQSALNSIYRESLLFEEDCAPNMQRSHELEQTIGRRSDDYILFPNPSRSQLFVLSADERIDNANCRILSLDGRIIYNGIFDFKAGLPLNDLSMATGVYLIELHVSETNETIHKSFMYISE